MYKGSTNQKTGESMEKPGKKLKKFLIITGTTGLVYAGLKYLLPLVAPFFIGYTLALILRPSVRFIRYRFQFFCIWKNMENSLWIDRSSRNRDYIWRSGDLGLAGNPAPVPGTAASGSPSAPVDHGF